LASPNTTLRLGRADDELLLEMQRAVFAKTRTETVRLALHALREELRRRDRQVEELVPRLERLIPTFDRSVVDIAGYDGRRERPFARVDDVTYIALPAPPLTFAERILEDGTTERTLVEEGGENAAKRMWIQPARFEA
jgi:hypothetical protein